MATVTWKAGESSPTTISEDNVPSFTTTTQGPSSSTASNSTVSAVNNYIGNMLNTNGSSTADAIREVMQIVNGNSALSQSYAQEMMDYQTASDKYAMNWSAEQSALSREWQENLANTSHQREVLDLVAAGLNPVLSANNGAATPTGATGQAYTSSGAMGSVDTSSAQLLSTMINSASQLEMQKLSLQGQLNMQAAQIASNERINHVNADASIMGHQISAAATAAAATKAYESAIYGADKNAENIQKQIENALAIAKLPNSGSVADAYKIIETLFGNGTVSGVVGDVTDGIKDIVADPKKFARDAFSGIKDKWNDLTSSGGGGSASF